MKFLSLLFMVIVFTSQISCQHANYAGKGVTENIPTLLKGNFMDDYGIQFTITDSLWTQHPNVKYHIISWDTNAQYAIAQNDENNPSDKGLFTRIDYIPLADMDPFTWGFCLTVYKAKTIDEAKARASADRQNPKKGCNGYPFSRMKRIDVIQSNNLKNY